jgi:hypothetical protein
MIETVFGMGGIELTPGVASATSCPEAIWQSAIWWHDYYQKTAAAHAAGKTRPRVKSEEMTARAPEGRCITRQPAAAVVEEPQPPPHSVTTRRSSRGRRRAP